MSGAPGSLVSLTLVSVVENDSIEIQLECMFLSDLRVTHQCASRSLPVSHTLTVRPVPTKPRVVAEGKLTGKHVCIVFCFSFCLVNC